MYDEEKKGTLQNSLDCCSCNMSALELRQAALEWLREHPGTEKVELREVLGASSTEVQAWEVREKTI